MGRKKTRDGRARSDGPDIPILKSLPKAQLERAVMQALAVGAYCFSHSPGVWHKILRRDLGSGRPSAKTEPGRNSKSSKKGSSQRLLNELLELSQKLTGNAGEQAASGTRRLKPPIEEGVE